MKKLFFTLCLCVLPASISHAQAVINGKIRITPVIDVIAGAERNEPTTASVWVDAKNQHSHQGDTNAIDDAAGGKGGSTDKPTVSKTPIIDVIIDENQQPENNGGTQNRHFILIILLQVRRWH
ncbi:MAG: hypothetical protein IPL35_17815 [Sphingobacteriales bacterium]|nr:hypothetical protein [Sphingobacteriales bacterium]